MIWSLWSWDTLGKSTKSRSWLREWAWWKIYFFFFFLQITFLSDKKWDVLIVEILENTEQYTNKNNSCICYDSVWIQVIETPRKQRLKQHVFILLAATWSPNVQAGMGVLLPRGLRRSSSTPSSSLFCSPAVWPASSSSKLAEQRERDKRPRTHASCFLGKVLRISNTLPSHPIG